MSVTNWMAWEGGVDLVALTKPGLQMPNLIVHVARMVHTPAGSAASGLILYQPDPTQNPLLAGFVSENPTVGKYFGPAIFAGTPFENAPVLEAKIQITTTLPGEVQAKVTVAGFVFETQLKGLATAGLINRAPAPMTPFTQQGVEAAAGSALAKVNGQELPIIVPPVGISGGPAAVFSPCGIYAK